MTACAGVNAKPEKERYLDVITEMTCLVFSTPDLMDPGLEDKVKAIFKEHGFDADDEQAMLELANRYEGDADVELAAEAALQSCAGDLLDAMNGEIPEEEVVEEAVVDVEDASEVEEAVVDVEDASSVVVEEAPAAE